MATRARNMSYVLREESWDSLHYSDASTSSSRRNGSADGSMQEQKPPALLTVGDVHRAMYPLQATADRLGRQVEQFAETLDRLGSRNLRERKRDCSHVLPLVIEYERIAAATVERLRKKHEPDRQVKATKHGRHRSRTSSERSTPISIHEDDQEMDTEETTLKDIQNWEEEQQTWRLLGIMLQLQFPDDRPPVPWPNERYERPIQDIQIHEYSSEHELWQKFLAEDKYAWERHVVVEWLRESAESSGADIDDLVKKVEIEADRGTGLMAHGWLYSREEIKRTKVLQSWPKPIDPASPGIDNLLASPDRSERWVTQLDPDAFSRQGRNLKPEDVFYERATWLACWEMTRRGRSWDSIRNWFQDRNEVWKALAMRGDPRTSTLGTWQSRALWRNICHKAAKHGGVDPYENAVYGVLSGDLSSVERVARGWDDYLFAHYNSYLIHDFDLYVQKRFPARLPESSKERFMAVNPMYRDLDPMAVIRKLQSEESLQHEAKHPMKLLQVALLTKNFSAYVQDHGLMLAQSANEQEESKLMRATDEAIGDESLTANITLQNYDLLRILTHMIFIFKELDPSQYENYATESIVVGYVDFLCKAGKQQLLPLYASKLSRHRSITCMGRQLPFITDTREREIVLRLMRQYGIHVEAVLRMQILMIVLDTPPNYERSEKFPKLDILDSSTKNPKTMATVKKNFMGRTMSGDEQDIVNAFEWYLLLDGGWDEIMNMGVITYKWLLTNKSMAAMRELVKVAGFSEISRRKTPKHLDGRSVDIGGSQPVSEDEIDESVDLRRSSRSRSAQLRTRRSASVRRQYRERQELLREHSQSFRDLESLTNVLEALEYWKDIESQAADQADPRHAKPWKTAMQDAHNKVVESMRPILRGDWLQSPRTESDAEAFAEIRKNILPELILAYNSVLNFGGHALSREILLKCMDLAATVARQQDLCDCFIAAGRMSELVDSMAIASKSILRAEELGRHPNKKPKKLNGETMEIWTLKGMRDRLDLKNGAF